ncbi:MAG: signal peptidase I [Oscillospiraceae bacterium]|nr:signal peptidase I [Oscillospiraceae bacterium]
MQKLDQITSTPDETIHTQPAANSSKTATFVSNVLFYLAIALCLVGAVLWRGNAGGTFFGYRMFAVTSGSMQREIPQDALVLVKEATAADIALGSDITFIRSDGEIVTHRVVEINNSVPETPAYRTKGLENEMIDAETVYLGNVLGTVQNTVPKLGGVLLFVKENLPLLGALFGALLLLSFSLRLLFEKPAQATTQPLPMNRANYEKENERSAQSAQIHHDDSDRADGTALCLQHRHGGHQCLAQPEPTQDQRCAGRRGVFTSDAQHCAHATTHNSDCDHCAHNPTPCAHNADCVRCPHQSAECPAHIERPDRTNRAERPHSTPRNNGVHYNHSNNRGNDKPHQSHNPNRFKY